MRSLPSLVRPPATLLVFVVVAMQAHAATLRVEVRERGGDGIDGVVVSIVPYDSVVWYERKAKATTGRDGKVTLQGIPPGKYRIALSSPRDPDLVLPEENPWAEEAVVTLASEDSSAEIAIELWRGIPIALDVLSPDSDLPPTRVVLRQVETGKTIEQPFGPRDGTGRPFRRAVVEGRWDASLDIAPGFTIDVLELDGEPITGGVVSVDTAADPRVRSIHWEVRAPCEVWGRVLAADGVEVRDVTVFAELLEPGPWLERERARGRHHGHVSAQRWEPPDVFHIRLPEGLWRIRPDGSRVQSADPPHVELRLVAGETRRQDFRLRLGAEERGAPLEVEVLTPDGERLPGATVGLFRNGTAGTEPPIETVQSGGRDAPRAERGIARFTDVPAGTYDVVAGHPDWLDGSATITVDPEAKDAARATVRVEAGATLVAQAVLANGGASVAGVEVTLGWTGGDPPSVLDDPHLVEARRVRRARTDTAGLAMVGGLFQGTYRLEAHVQGKDQRSRYARVRLGEREEKESVDLGVVPPQRYLVELAVYAGASLTGIVRCDDGGPLPPAISVDVYDTNIAWEHDTEIAREEGEPALRIESLLLEGSRLDRFTIGPLEGGAYAVALRPRGHDGWAWLYDTDLRDEAAILHVEPERAVDVGTVEALCAPALVLRPQIADSVHVPDMRLGSYRAHATVASEVGAPIVLPASVDARPDHLLVRGLVPGMVDLRVEVHHPYLIPSVHVFERSDLALERGRRPSEEARFASVGGAIKVRTTAAAVRLAAAETAGTIVSALEGEAHFEGVPAGTYRLAECDTSTCSGTVPGRIVNVVALRTAHVDLRVAPK